MLHLLGADVTVNDGKDLSHDAHAHDLETMGIKVVSGAHPLALLDESPIIFKNPGIPYSISILEEAENVA